MDLKSQYTPAMVFQDAVKYTDQDRENARRAAQLIAAITTTLMENAGQPDQYNLYLRAYAFDLLFQDSKEPGYRQKALEDYEKTVELGGSYAQADYDRLAAMEVQAAPLAWQVPQMLTLDEVGQILGVAGGDLFFADSAYQKDDGSRLGVGYALRSVKDPASSTIFVLADPQGGEARYDVLKSFACLQKVEEIAGLGDEAVLMGLRNMDNEPALYTTALVRKDQLVLQVRVPDYVWRGAGFNADPERLAVSIAKLIIQNLFDVDRPVPDVSGITSEGLFPMLQLDVGLADSPVPDTMPEDLGGKTPYGYLVEIRQQYLPDLVFADPKYDEATRNDARRAVRLLVSSLSQGFDAYGLNPYELEIRAACYAAAYEDTGNVAFRYLAVNDYKQALSAGYSLAWSGYVEIATPLLSQMAELKKGDSGGYVRLMQQWLIDAGYLSGKADGSFGSGTQKAVKAYEEAKSLTPDGIADIAFLLALYAEIDDGDALYYLAE